MLAGLVIGYLALGVILSLALVCAMILGARADEAMKTNDWKHPVRAQNLTPATKRHVPQS
jgi:hypothetical protein